MTTKGAENTINRDKGIQDKARQLIEKQICETFNQKMRDFSRQIKQYPLQMSMSTLTSQNEILNYRTLRDDAQSSFVIKQFLNILESLAFDRSLTKQPEFGRDIADLSLKGNCWKNM